MGNLISSTYPPKPKWSSDDIPDLAQKVFLITGANTGIGADLSSRFFGRLLSCGLPCLGKEVARDLLAHNGKVYIAARSAEKAADAIEDLKKTTGKGDDSVQFLKLDLMDLKSVKSAVDEFLSLVLASLVADYIIIKKLVFLSVA